MKITTISNILLLLVLFPYISLSYTPYDTQPYALIFSFFIFSILVVKKNNNLSFPRPLGCILLIFLYAICIYHFFSDHLYGYRSLAGYASIFFIALASYKTFKYINVKYYIISIFIWLFFGVAQLTIDKYFCSWLLPRMSSSVTRGVTSLAVEPSYYAIVCIFLLILNDVFYITDKYNKSLYFIIMIILSFQILISLSGLGLLFLTIFFFAKIISVLLSGGIVRNFSAVCFCGMVSLVFLFSFFYIPELQSTRGGVLLTNAINDPMMLFYTDGSIADRASHLLLSSYSLIYSHGIGLGLGTWNNINVYALINSAGGWVEKIASVDLSIGGRILSGWGSAFFELGIVGVFLFLTVLWIMFFGMRRNKKMRSVYLSSSIVIFSIMCMAVPLAFPLFGYIIGIFLYYNYLDTNNFPKKEALV